MKISSVISARIGISVLLLTALVVSGIFWSKHISSDPEKSAFLKHLRSGHSIKVNFSDDVYMAKLRTPIEVCVLADDLDKGIEKTLQTLMQFMSDVVLIPTHSRDVTNFNECPDDTYIFLRIHNDFLDEDDFVEYYHNISTVKGIVPKQGIVKTSWGGVQRLSDGKQSGAFVNARQISSQLPNDGVALPFAKAILIQELFQSFFLGNDIPRSGDLTSILEEVDTTFSPSNPAYIKENAIDFIKHTATGLCKFDLMSIIALRDNENREELFSSFIERTTENYTTILAEAEQIILDSSSTVIFDRRCT